LDFQWLLQTAAIVGAFSVGREGFVTPLYRVALVGAGNISLYHVRAWAAVGAEVVAACDIDRARALERSREFGVPRIYEDAGALFAAGGFDVVDIAASVNAHAPLARQAADHGVHIMVQKPLCEAVAEGGQELPVRSRPHSSRLPWMNTATHCQL
jgi:Zn-dependent alcohol dehydrogenase